MLEIILVFVAFALNQPWRMVVGRSMRPHSSTVLTGRNRDLPFDRRKQVHPRPHVEFEETTLRIPITYGVILLNKVTIIERRLAGEESGEQGALAPYYSLKMRPSPVRSLFHTDPAGPAARV